MTGSIVSASVLWVLLAQGTACLAAGLVGSCLLRRRAARAHQVLLTGLLAAVLMPATYLLVRNLELGLLTPPAVASRPVSAEDRIVDEVAIESIPAMEADPETIAIEVADLAAFAPAYETPTPKVPWAVIGLISWTTATLLLLGRLLLRFVLGLCLLQRARPVETPALCDALQTARDRMGIAAPVALRASENVRSPVIWCWRRVPVLLVHEHPQATKARDWVGVFCHELAHWKRLDHVSGLLAELLTAALPWHPLTWWVKGHLSRLSEEVCDDWVLASGHTGVDYAESLLSLAPQSQLAILPTVVGKERVMKKRIYRIVKERCGNPTVGRRWALGVSVLVISVATGVALAQPGPVRRGPGEPRPMAEPAQRPPRNQALVREARRNVLERMLDQLREQVRDTEVALREEGDQPGERRQLLRAELAALRNQIGQTERQLANLNRPEPESSPVLGGPVVEGTRQANERLLDLRANAERTHRALETIDDADSPEAQELRESFKVTEREIHDTEMWLDLQQQRATAARAQAAEAATRVRQEQQLARRRAAAARESAASARRMRLDQMGAETREMELRLRELEERGQTEGDEAQALRNDLRIMRDKLRDTRQATPRQVQTQARALRPAGATGGEAFVVRQQKVEGRRAEIADSRERMLAARSAEARAQMEHLQRRLEELRQSGQGDNDEAAEIRETLRALQRERQSARRETAAARRTRLARQIAQIEQNLQRMENPSGDRAAALRRELRQLQAELERLNAEAPPTSAVAVSRTRAATTAPSRSATPRATRRPGTDRALETEIEQLRGQVNGLNDQMQQMQRLLEHLVAQKEAAR